MSEAEKEKKPKKPGRWNLKDAIIGIFGLVAIIAMTVAAFLAARWVKDQYF
ncbi:MAG: hypothetical protein JRI95_12395 [Deltaproteobacteria bacterium]|nr:hypothetical protein [Deltaproteobacteria bacterium]MBW2086476.1 hypothetical protein [Deltaproteobacteria bacterium]